MKYFAIFFLAACSTFSTSEHVLVDSEKTYTFPTHDLNLVLRTFGVVLKKEGYDVKTQDLQTGKIAASADKTETLGNVNSELNVGSNYKVSEGLDVAVQLKNSEQGIVSYMDIQRTDKYSMGQDSVEPFNDPTLYQEIFSKVKLEL